MDHPNIVKAFHYGETERHFCLYMEYAGYGSNYLSRRVLTKNKPVKEDKLSIWANDILQGMWYMHQRGVIHTDIKLDNILIFDKEVQEGEDVCPIAKICDFGLCHVMEPGKQTALMERLVGT